MSGITVYGAPWCPDCRRTKAFLGEHRVAYEWIDIDHDPEGERRVLEINRGKRIIPTVAFPDGSTLAEPSDAELALQLGLQLRAERSFYDLIVIGGGPTGLTASIYAAREGIDALVLDASALGGQAGVTERIDNYPGFPEGIKGTELAERIVEQARRYDVTLLPAVGATGLRRDGDYILIRTDQGDEYCAHAALVATGSSYRRLGVPGEEDLIGAGIHFCATCDGPFYRGADELLVIGGGNSGLEEGLFLSRFAERIRVVEFMPELKASAILQERVRSDPRFTIHLNTQVTAFERSPRGELAAVRACDRGTGRELRFEPAAAFVFVGLDPNTGFLNGHLETDPAGFIVTSPTFETSMPGVFAAGDVRSGSTKQLGAAIGEGITALIHIRQHLERLGDVHEHEVG
jgi:thioredoxin reductase (NADPH)